MRERETLTRLLGKMADKNNLESRAPLRVPRTPGGGRRTSADRGHKPGAAAESRLRPPAG